MPLDGEYEPSAAEWVRDQVDLYERSGGVEGTTLRDMPVIILTSRGASSGKLRKTPLMRVEHDGTTPSSRPRVVRPPTPLVLQPGGRSPRRAPGRPGEADRIAREVTGDEKALVVGAGRGRLPRLRRLPGEDRPADPGLRARAAG